MTPKMESSHMKLRELSEALERMAENGGEKYMTEYHKGLLKWTRNVDKRYAWLVLVAAFLLMGSLLGPYRMYGLMFAKVTKESVYNHEEAAWPVAMVFTVENLVGPLVSIIVYYTTHRISLLIGTLLVAFGNGAAYYSKSLILDIILVGIVQGVGYSFIFTPFMAIINSYFVRYRNLALGIALCGGTLSSFILTPIMRIFFDNHEWRDGYLAFCAVSCIGILMIPILGSNVRPTSPRATAPNSPKLDDQSTFARLSFRALSYQNSIRSHSTIVVEKTKQGIERQASVVSMNPFASSVGIERRISRSITEEQQQQQQQQQQDVKKSLQPVGSELSLSTLEHGNEAMSLSEVGQDHEEFEFTMMLNILKTPAFHLIWYNELVYFWIFSIYCLVMVDYGTDRGCTKEEAETLINFYSIGEIFGRLVLTYIVDLKFVSNRNVVTLVLLLLASITTLITQVTGFYWLGGITICLSALIGLLYILLNGLLVDFLGEHQVTLGYGLASCIGGALMSVRPYAVGYFRDDFGTYDPLMLCMAIASIIGATLWIIEPILTKLAGKTKLDEKKVTQSII